MSKLKSNIQRILNERDVSLAKLAQLCGVPQSTLHRIMTGAIAEPRSSTIAPLASFLGVSVAALRDGDLLAPVTFHNVGHADKQQATDAPHSPDLSHWDKAAQAREFEVQLTKSVPREYLEWRSVIDGVPYRLDYCSERLAVDLMSFSNPSSASHPRTGQVDFSTLYKHGASHLLDLVATHRAFPNLHPLLLILCPAEPNTEIMAVKKLLNLSRQMGVPVRFVTHGSGAVQVVLKTESELLDDSLDRSH